MNPSKIRGLSFEAFDFMIDRGIIDYVNIRYNGIISGIVLYGDNAEIVLNELNERGYYDCVVRRKMRCGVVGGFLGLFNDVEYTCGRRNYGVIEEKWHIDVDDLVHLYSKGMLNR